MAGSESTVARCRGDPLTGVTIRAQGAAASKLCGRRGTDGSYSIANLSPGSYSVSASLPGLRTQSQQNVQVRADAETVADFVMQALQTRSGDGPPPCCASSGWRRTVLDCRAHRAGAAHSRADNIEAVAANVAGFSVAEPRPWPKPGRDPRSLVGSDRARPARVKEEWAPTSTNR